MIKSQKEIKAKLEKIPEKVSLEYQKAQDSAEHHNTIIWTLVSVGLAFSIIILYKVISNEIKDSFIEIMALFIGIFVLFYFSFIIESTNEMKQFKYFICQKIEKEQGLIGQNYKLKKLPLSKLENIGIGILRLTKMILFIFYLLAIAFYIEISSDILVFGVILIILIILAFFMEIYYIFKKQPNFEEILNEK